MLLASLKITFVSNILQSQCFADIIIHLCFFRLVQTSVKIVQLQAISFTHCFSLADHDTRRFRCQGWFHRIYAKKIVTVMHYAIISIFVAIRCILRRLLVEV